MRAKDDSLHFVCKVILRGVVFGTLGFLVFLTLVQLGCIPLIRGISRDPLLVFSLLVYFAMGIGGSHEGSRRAARDGEFWMSILLMIGIGVLLIASVATEHIAGAHQIFVSALFVFPLSLIVWLAAYGSWRWPSQETVSSQERWPLW